MNPNTEILNPEILNFAECLMALSAAYPDEESPFDFNRPLGQWPRPSLTEIIGRHAACPLLTPVLTPFAWLGLGACCPAPHLRAGAD